MRTFENPVMGDTIEILDEGDLHAGRPIQARVTLAPYAQGPPLHYHPGLLERYEVIQGTGSIQVGTERLELGPGEVVDIPPGTRHRFWNPTSEPVVLAAQVRPPSPRFLDFLDSLYGLARDGLTDDTGRPSPLRAALIFHTYRDEVVPADPPVVVQRLVFPVLAAIARARGYRT
jgi:hypothetical protein